MNTEAQSPNPAAGNRARVPAVPDLVRKEALAAVAGTALLCLVSAVLDAPLEGPADTSAMPGHSVSAPWIFVGIQQLLRFFPTALAGIVLPLAALAGLAIIPWVPSGKRAGATALFLGIALVAAGLTLWGLIR